jgi:hypothetical protein
MRGYPDRDLPCRGFFLRRPHAVRMVIARAIARASTRNVCIIRTLCGPRRFPHGAPARARLGFAPI